MAAFRGCGPLSAGAGRSIRMELSCDSKRLHKKPPAGKRQGLLLNKIHPDFPDVLLDKNNVTIGKY
jgi:hypothetical protein